MSPAVLEQLWPLATRFQLEEGEQATLPLRLAIAPAELRPGL